MRATKLLRPDTLLTKDTLLSVLLLLVVVLAVNAMLPPWVDGRLEMVISKNKVGVSNLNQPRNIDFSKVVELDKLDLSRGNRLAHPKLGDIGYGNNFFAGVDARFEVEEGGNYQFVVASDDGFELTIDGQRICGFAGDRPMRSEVCRVRLDEGEHRFQLKYFQGGGHAGLAVQYRRRGDSDLHWFGEDSPYLEIVE